MYRLNDIVSTLLKSLKLSYYPTSNECFLNVNANVSYSIIFIILHFVYIYTHICNKHKYKKEVYNLSTESNHIMKV